MKEANKKNIEEFKEENINLSNNETKSSDSDSESLETKIQELKIVDSDQIFNITKFYFLPNNK